MDSEDIKPNLRDLPKYKSSSDSSSSDSENSDSSGSSASSVDRKGRSVRHKLKKPSNTHRDKVSAKLASRLGERDRLGDGRDKEVKPKLGSHVAAVEVKRQRDSKEVKPEKTTVRTYDYITKLNYLFRDARFFVIKSNNMENVDIAKKLGECGCEICREYIFVL